MQTRSLDRRTIVLAAFNIFSAVAAFGLAVLAVIYSVLQPAFPINTHKGPAPFEAMLLASTLALVSALFIPAAYYNIREILEKDIPAASPKPLHVWQGFLLIAAWIASAVLAQTFFNNETLRWFSPLFYLLSIILPAYFLLRLATGGLSAGSRLRVWSVLSTGMALGTSFAVVAEIGLVILGLGGAGIYLFLHPEQTPFFQQLADKLISASTVDDVMAAAGSLISSPLTILVALLFLSVFTPLIEETAKSLTVWLMFNRLDSPAQGFVAGALSGAGFGLLESLLASAAPDSSWSATLLVRGMSTMMHILAASLTGWGIASYRLNKRPARMIGMYALAMSLHSLWNASVVMIFFGGMRMAFNSGPSDLLGTAMVSFSSLILITLCLALPISMGIFNRIIKGKVLPPSLIMDAANQEGVK
ncbi:MAG: PrsW family intramembrane metalloprotease [Chloroflexi bacterium]|nr:PrsW family intramembrane metalloprotease [Chloroflexota bacterium]